MGLLGRTYLDVSTGRAVLATLQRPLVQVCKKPEFELAIAYRVFQGLPATVLVVACYWACFHQEEPESFSHCAVGDSMQMASPW